MSHVLTQASRARLLEHDLDELAVRIDADPAALRRAVHEGRSLPREVADRLGAHHGGGYVGLFQSCIARERRGPSGESYLPAAGVRAAAAIAVRPEELYRQLQAHGWIDLDAAEVIADAAARPVTDLFEVRERDGRTT